MGGMRRSPILRPASVLALALALSACGSATESPSATDPASGATSSGPTTSAPTVSPTPSQTLAPAPDGAKPTPVTMTGTLAEGVESGCLVFTDEATGETYAITEPVPGDGTGGRVTVTGTVDPDMMSFCMQGPVLLVEEIEPAG